MRSSLICALFFFIYFTPTLSIRFLFGSEIICDDPNYVFNFNISYWNGDHQIAKERQLSARGSLFFYHEGAAIQIYGDDIHANIIHDCTDDGKMKTEKYNFQIQKGLVLYRLDYTFTLNNDHGEH